VGRSLSNSRVLESVVGQRRRVELSPTFAGVAQLVEQLIRNQQVTRSSRVAGSI
jgi:hypothetical protein